ncbi:hypothetical protein [Pseudoxanthomonas sp.]|uniref:hypothetical protein n=1 Tax=Pseudoxanthomonas sp. TaxID=1871049 RepID=UPI00262E2FE1|nr:hypothetical protein [Pseudoxanthomonas sp.]WDS36239.1 MAG: hypothetical protein O8I58_18540 [Pseudoxanthomonas sp.]
MADAIAISALTSVSGLDGTEYFPVVKDSVTQKATPAQIVELFTVPALYKTITAAAATTRTASNDDAWKYIRFTATLAKTYDFLETASLTAGYEWEVKNASTNSTLTIASSDSSVTINRPDGKAAIVPIGGHIWVKVISTTQIDIYGDLQDSVA